MDTFVDSLIGNTGCSVDASITNNPLANLANQILDGGAGWNLEPSNAADLSTTENVTVYNNWNSSASNHQDSSQLESIWSQSVASNNNYSGIMGDTNNYTGMPYMMNSFYPQLSRQTPMTSSSIQKDTTIETTAKENSTINITNTTHTTGINENISIDSILQEALNDGHLSQSEMDDIHRIIGYDPNLSIDEIKTNLINYDKLLVETTNGKEDVDLVTVASEMKELTEPSKTGYTQAWEKLSTKLENLEDSRTIIEFTEISKNPYLSNTIEYNNTVYNYETLHVISQKLFSEGDIYNAILASEANVQKYPEQSEGWHMLGISYAENEDDKKALYCLKKAVELDPYNLSAQLALGTSYVNESNSVGAMTALKNWVKHNPLFQDVSITNDAYSDGTMMDEIMQMMLNILQVDTTNADVHTVMGILYNTTMNYTAAIDHFKQAVTQRPNDYALLNKLGATLANNKQSVEAVQYYAQALQIRPGYVRGWVNLGIAYYNMGDTIVMKEIIKSAAKSFLQALYLAPNTEHVWSYLRMSLTALNMHELVQLSTTETSETIEILAKELETELVPPTTTSLSPSSMS